jgi:hypothetical protein
MLVSNPGLCPVRKSRWKTLLFPKGGIYLVRIKASVRKAKDPNLDDEVAIRRIVG